MHFLDWMGISNLKHCTSFCMFLVQHAAKDDYLQRLCAFLAQHFRIDFKAWSIKFCKQDIIKFFFEFFSNSQVLTFSNYLIEERDWERISQNPLMMLGERTARGLNCPRHISSVTDVIVQKHFHQSHFKLRFKMHVKHTTKK